MKKVNRTQATQIIVFVACALFIISYFAPFNIFLNAQPESDWVAHPMYISPFPSSSTPLGYSPAQMRTAYNLPSWGGNGTTIAIIDAYDTPKILTYFNVFCNQYNLPDNSTGNFFVHKMSASMRQDSGWAMETSLDVEWAHAIAPNATILLVEATSSTDGALLAAIDYATSQPGVVAVSMSWGGEEMQNEGTSYYENHFNKQGIAFFASSGDDGSTVMWPAASASVVGVGGTTLNLNPDGTVISEVAWSNSSGGVSAYVVRPTYQSNLGPTYPNRAVPDVSYNGNASTGVAVYDGTWHKMGGTSAGAPQWAAIHSLGLSATNNNLYNRAKTAVSTYFRDITTGSNYVNQAVAGYDLVTGLGSPLATNFGTEVTVSPTSGPPNGAVSLSGVGFNPGISVNITYRNPKNSSWMPLTNNLAVTSDTFTFALNAPDLLQNNLAGDNQPQFDNIIFRVTDNSNGRSYNTTVPYAEWRRGLTQAGNVTAQGLFGNSTNLATSVFVQNGATIPFSGAWFSPGNISLVWDNTTNLGTVLTDNSGFFNTIVTVPTSSAGQHTVTVSDGATIFCVNLTRLPTVANDYVDGWHTSDITVNLTPDYAVNETFYRLNGGPIQNVSANGQPIVAVEGSGNTLEYWSTWNVYGTGITELPHVTITGIMLDKTAPAGTITTGAATTQTTAITLAVTVTDSTAGTAQMRFSNDNASWSDWESYEASKTWTLQSGDGQKTVIALFMDNAGLTSTASYTLTLETPQPTAAPTTAPTNAPAPTTNPTVHQSTAQTESATSSPIPDKTASPKPADPTQTKAPAVPEIPSWILLVFVFSTLMLAVIIRKKSVA